MSQQLSPEDRKEHDAYHSFLRELTEIEHDKYRSSEKWDYFIRRSALSLIAGAIIGYIALTIDDTFGTWYWITLISCAIIYATGVCIYDIKNTRFK